MVIDVALNPAEIALLPSRDLSTTTCVVFDILRATSSMITALAGGAAEIRPVCTIEEARALKVELPAAVLGGERHGDRIEGFDVGNSPFEYRKLPGRTIVSTTTNGTVALRAVERAERVFVGALLNLGGLVEEIDWVEAERLLLVCAGTFEEMALEDVFAAGLLIRMIDKQSIEMKLTDSARVALAVSKQYATPMQALAESRNGQALAAKGRRDEVEWCARESQFSIVGQMESAVIRPIPQ